MIRAYTISLFLILLVISTCWSQSSVLSAGNWYKLGVAEHGVYKLTHDNLKRLGIDPGKTDPRNIKIFGQVGGMLPQANAAPRPSDLVELAILVVGESDGKFDRQDYVLFYAQGPDHVSYVPEKQLFFYENNIYSDINYYFLTVGDTPGKRMASAASTGTSATVISTYDDFVYHERDDFKMGLSFNQAGDPYELKSGRAWYGERFDLNNAYQFEYNLDGIVDNSTLRFVSNVVAQSFASPTFKIYFNSALVGEQVVPAVLNTQYSVKGHHKADTFAVNTTSVSAAGTSRQVVRYEFQSAGSGRSIGILDYFMFSFKRTLSMRGMQMRFRNAESINAGVVEYRISNVNAAHRLINVTNPYEPFVCNFTTEGAEARFGAPASASINEFVVFEAGVASPELIGVVQNQNLHGMATPAVVIVTHPDFLSEAQRLAEHRAATNGVTTAVVTTEQVYNEFSSGRQDITAIRDFAKYLYDKQPSVLKTLVLFGKGTYDYKNKLNTNASKVPIYQSRNSLHPLESYSSDDYFGFMEQHEGLWSEGLNAENHSMDIGVGRLPVTTAEEAAAIVDKIIDYDLNPRALGNWRKNIAFVADDGSKSDGFTNIHQAQANSLAELIESANPEFNTRKLFLGTYEKNISPSGETVPKANADILELFNRSLIINFTGHGSEKIWTDENIFSDVEVEKLRNRTFPFLVTATCEFGRHDNPTGISTAELSLLKEQAGAIGLVTTTRPVNSNTNFALNLAFYEAFFTREDAQFLTIGEVFRRTKNNSSSGVFNRNFSLLGDPSMQLASPELNVTVTSISTRSGSDTLKALSRVTLKGEVRSHQGATLSNFNGIVEVTIYDKRTQFKTIGRNDPAFQFDQYHNPLFNGQATVKSGVFELQFIVPKNIAYEVSTGKLSLYAYDDRTHHDATGANTTVKVGSSETHPPPDNTPPKLSAYMGDATFINGGKVSPTTRLVVRVEDASGANMSNYGIGNTMVAVLDDDRDFFLINEYYTADVDDFTKGWIDYPLYDLPVGRHTFTVRVWDTYNNAATTTVDFVVTGEGEFLIESCGNYPNPFSATTTLYFTHNRAGEDLEVMATILEATGQQVKHLQYTVPGSLYRVDLPELSTDEHFGKKLAPGIYFVRFAVRSLSDGAKNVRVAKLIVVN